MTISDSQLGHMGDELRTSGQTSGGGVTRVKPMETV